MFLLLLSLACEVSGSEICRFRALDAENPLQRWLGSQEVTCVAAGAALEFPSGLWNVFVRREGMISTTPLLIDGDATATVVDPPLVAGATVTPMLAAGRTGVIYVPRRGIAYPVDGAHAIVPADEPLWLFVLDKSLPEAVFPIAPLAAGSERTIDARGGGVPSLVGWLHVPEAERNALATVSGVASPVIRAGSRESDPLPPPSQLHAAFYRISGIAGPSAALRVDGRGWLPDRRVVRMQPGLTVAAAPLLLRATGTLTVHWNSEQDLAALERSIGSCEKEDAPQVAISIAKCAVSRPSQATEPEACTSIAEHKTDAFFGSVTFDDVAPGLYRAEMRYGRLPATIRVGSVQPLLNADIRVRAEYFPLHGSVTHGGEPLGEDVSIELPGGIGFAPEDSEEYHAVTRTPGIAPETPIMIAACDGSPRAIVLADAMRRSSRVDIDIPANVLEVQVTDTFTREALGGAVVKLEAMAVLRPSQVVFTTTRNADESGTVTLAAVPLREIRLTVTHPGYETRRVEAFTMPKSGRHTIDAQLVPLRGTRGRIVSNRAFENGAVVWFSPTGSQTERVELATDGTFVHQNWHTREETMAVLSSSHPLWVMRAPESERRQSLNLRFPDEPAVGFDVWLASAARADEARYVGIVIGGVRVPQPVLAQHQTMRRNPPLLRGAGPQSFRDLLATGPIDVLLGPPEKDVDPRQRHLDIFAFADYANVPRQRVGAGETDVVLGR